MGRRLSVPGVAACLVAGIALWFTRASLDVVPGARGEVRVAMFPSLAELGGLLVLTFVVVFLIAALLDRLRRPLPTDALIPLFSLAWLAVPYLPWLPDVIPTLRVYAGPARFLVWAVVLGQVAWTGWQTWRSGSAFVDSTAATSPQGRSLFPRGWWVLAATLVGFGAAAAMQADGPLHPAGDETHYLALAERLLTGDPLHGDGVEMLPVGLPVLIAPALAAGGYRAVVCSLVLLSAVTAAGGWWWAAQRTGSAAGATLGWLAVAGSAPFVLHSNTIAPGLAAAALVLASFAGTPRHAGARTAFPLVQGLIVGALPWLGATYAPMSLAIAILLMARHGRRRAATLVLASYALSAAAWLAVSWPLGHSTLLTSVAAATPYRVVATTAALMFDQEIGLLPLAPALLLALPGLWHMWSRGASSRREAIELIVTAGTLLATAGVWTVLGGGRPSPVHPAVAILPLLVLPIAWWDVAARRWGAVSAAGRILALAGVAIAATLVVVRQGALVLNRGDGSSQWLEWLAPSRDLVRVAPSSLASQEALALPSLITILWLVALATAALALSRVRRRSPGQTASIAFSTMVVAGLCAAAVTARLVGGRIPQRTDPAARIESVMLSRFDARARPAAIVYDPWQHVAAEDVPPLFAFEGRPGLRRDPQPLRVLHNTRLALPAGRYDVELRPAGNQAIDGSVGLQLGRTGRPVCDWYARSDPGQPWTQEFRVDVDAPFVGFRTDAALEHAVGEVVVRPRAVVNAAERIDRRLALPPVLAAAQYGDIAVYFHDGAAYPERDGFWVRGASEITVTLATSPESTRSSVRLEVHSGSAPNRVRFSAGTIRQDLSLEPGAPAHVEIPLLPSARQAVVHIQTESGFIPAETSGGTDRRLLGCWVRVAD